MQVEFPSIAIAVRQSVIGLGTNPSLGHVQEICAAALGYKTYASYRTSPEESTTFADAKHIVLDTAGIASRVMTLGYPAAQAGVYQSAIAQSLKRLPNKLNVYLSVSDLLDDIRQDIEQEIDDSGAVNRAMAETNAYPSTTDVEFDNPSQPLSTPAGDWALHVYATVEMDQDPDRVFYGDRIDVEAQICFPKTGRVCLAEHKLEDVSASLDHSWADEGA